jgi:hypothetical protein
VDATQEAIVKALRQLGVQVECIGKPVDLLLCFRGETSLMEVKSPGGRFTKDQLDFFGRWSGKIHVAHNPNEAIRALLGDKVLA